MNWSPWLLHKISRFGKSVLEKLDYTGEVLADTLGITTPKYAYEINQFKKQQLIKAKEEQKEKENTWQILKEASGPITKPPTQSNEV
jgi:FAM177 family